MNFFTKRRGKEPLPALPTDEEAAAYLRDKQLNFCGTVAEVVYSEDGQSRVVIIESEHGFFTAFIQKIFFFDDDELIYFPNEYPARWHTIAEGSGLYETKEIALREIESYPEYKTYFQTSF